MEEKLAIAYYNDPIELLNQKLGIFNICRHRKASLHSK